MQPAKPIIVDSIQKLNPTSVLDLGCGKCTFSQRFIEKGVTVIGVDKESKTESHDNFTFVQQDILDFEFELKSFLEKGFPLLFFEKCQSILKINLL